MPDEIFLLPGEMAFSREGATIATLLGSCVAVCLHDARRGWGGANHFMVPHAETPSTLAPGKTGVGAIDGLLRMAAMAGCTAGALTADIYGGGAVVGELAGGAGGVGDIGRRNVACARQRLAAAGVRVRREDVLGIHGRRIRFDTASGAVTVSPVGRAAVADPARRTGVLVVDDSATVRRLIAHVIAGADDLAVIGEAEDPFAARERLLELEPDVLCLDLIMPRLDGLTFLRRLMQYRPIPTVVVSTIAKAGSEMRRKVMDAGAVAVIDKEDLRLHHDPESGRRLLLPALRLAAGRAARLRPTSART